MSNTDIIPDKNSPIGIFDSGIGGLTVANAITRYFPNESIIYYGDTAHLPYGEKSPDSIRYFSLRIAKFLIDQGCKLIVIACNSAYSTSGEVLQEFFKGQVSFVNVVDPLVEKVKDLSLQKIGVIATKATINSGIYQKRLSENNKEQIVATLATPLLVPMIEEGFYNNKISETIIHHYLSDKSLNNIDAILLACTHYPLIRTYIEKYYDHSVSVFDSTDVVVLAVEKELRKLGLRKTDDQKNKHRFIVSDYTPAFEETTRLFYRESIELEHLPLW